MDRAIVTGILLTERAPFNGDPFSDETDGGEDTGLEYPAGDVIEADDRQPCANT